MSNTDGARLDSLELRLRRSERSFWIALFGWMVTVALGVIILLRAAPDARTVSDTIRLHKLVVLDQEGKERIVIAAPLPDPLVNGRRMKRRTGVSAGVQFKDPDGTERGGIASEDDGSFMFGIDDERGKERAHFYYIPNRGSGVYLQGENGSQALSLLNPPGLVDSPKLEITDPSGKPKADFPLLTALTVACHAG
jgi:hypothetical protein